LSAADSLDVARAGRAAPAAAARLRSPRVLLGILLPLGVALLWELAVRFGWATGRLMPPPSKIADTLWSLSRTGELWTHTAATLGRVLAGFAIGAAAGTLFGALSGASETARRLLDPTLQALRAVPSIAWVPLFLLWLGIF
jgi:sulfonate transport system permease protein